MENQTSNPADWRPTRESAHQPEQQQQQQQQQQQPQEYQNYQHHQDQTPNPGEVSPETPHHTLHRPPELSYAGPYANPNPSPFADPATPGFATAPGHAPSTPGYIPRAAAPVNDPNHPYGTTGGAWDTFAPTPSPRYGFHQRDGSQTELLDPYLDTTRQKPNYPPGSRGFFARAWDLYEDFWLMSWTMIFFLFCGILFAIGHHLFYASLEGKEAFQQMKIMRYGTALAFLSKASLVTAVILAFRQRAWMMVRRKMLSLGAVDSLFAATEDLSALFNWEALKSAKLAMCLAVYIWCTPLIVILTSETLSVQLRSQVENTTCPSVRTLNFTHEETLNWRIPVPMGNIYEMSASVWNTTMETPKKNDNNSFDYWTAPSQQFKTIANRAKFNLRTVSRRTVSNEICGTGWNCSFAIQFNGPGYMCEEVASGVDSKVRKLGGSLPRFNTSDLIPKGNFAYFAVADEGDYPAQQTDTGVAGVPKFPPPYPAELGAFKTEPMIWIGYATVKNSSQIQPSNRSVKGWDTAYTPKIMGCRYRLFDYNVTFNYTNSIQNVTVVSRKDRGNIIDTRFIRGVKDTEDGTWDNTTAVPRSNFVLATDVEKYRRIAAYHSVGKMMRGFINGTIKMPNIISETEFIETRLVTQPNYLPVDNFPQEVEKFYEEILLSMLANPSFITVSWASDPSLPSGPLPGDRSTRYPCVRQRVVNKFVYHKADLWAVYSVSILFAVVAVALGLLAIRELGYMRDTRFSSIVAATRAQSLNKVRWDREREIRDLKVGFGVVPGHSGEKTQGFGLEGDVTQEKPRQLYRSPAIGMMDFADKGMRRRSRYSGLFDSAPDLSGVETPGDNNNNTRPTTSTAYTGGYTTATVEGGHLSPGLSPGMTHGGGGGGGVGTAPTPYDPTAGAAQGGGYQGYGHGFGGQA